MEGLPDDAGGQRSRLPMKISGTMALDASEEGTWMDLEGNVYSAGIASVLYAIADVQQGYHKHTPRIHKWSRLLIVVAAIALAIFLQVFLVYNVKVLVCAKSVHFIRDVYSEYESKMYSETSLTVNGHHRGVAGTIMHGAFDDLEEELKENVCQIPLSQPDFLGAVLLMWTVTVLSEVRKCAVWAFRFVCITPTTPELFIKLVDDSASCPEPGTLALLGLPLWLKAAIALLFSIQGGTALFLGWVGCRWLVATPSFSDIILNGLALAFIVEIKEMLYNDLFPRIFHEDTELIRVQKSSHTLKLDAPSLAVPVCIALGSFAWVYTYMYQLQRVLPEYQWDIRLPCLEFLTELTAT